MPDREAAATSTRPFSAPSGTWSAHQWPVDVVRTDSTGEVDLEQIEYNLSLTSAQRVRQCLDWGQSLRHGRQTGEDDVGWSLEMLRRLNDAEVAFIVVGGVAASRHGTARVTEDLDVFAPLDEENARRIIRAFAGTHPRWRMRPDLPEISPDAPVLKGLKNMYLRTDLGQLDVLGELPGAGAFQEIASRAIEADFGQGIRCKVIDLETLIVAKQFAGRDKDRSDVRELEEIRQARKNLPQPEAND